MAESPTSAPQFYSQEQVQEILNVAIARQSYDGEFSREQLFEIADELGIPHTCLVSAEQTWLQQQTESQQKRAFDIYRQSKLKSKLGRYGIIGAGLLAITLTGVTWPLFIVGMMTVRIGMQAWTVYQQNEDAYERAFRRWLRSRQLSQFVNRWWTRVLSI